MRPRLPNVLSAAALFLGLFGMSEAQIVWSGTTSTFVLGSNWVGGNAPGPADTVQFGNHGGQSTIVVNSTTIGALDFLNTRTVVHNFLYTDGVATLTLNGNFTAAAGPDINFINTTNQLNLALPSGEHVFDIGGSTNVLIMGVVSGAGHLSKVGTGTLVLTGANTLNWNGTGAFNNGIAVDGGTLEINAGSISQPFQDIIVGSVSGGTGTLLVSNGGDVTAKYGVAGNDVSTNGTITVTGTGSTWTNSDGMALGYLGSGTLNVLAGGTVNTTGSGGDHSYLGLQFGTAGTATVSGTGSAWTTPNDQLIIGGNGTGNLTVSAGGLVSNTGGFVGLDATGAGTVTVNNGTWTNSAELIVANSGAGSLTISNGGDVTNTYSYIAAQSGGNGSATVDGAGSTWTNSGLLAVGQGGTGSLAITGGATVSSTEGYVGYAAGSSGNVSVSGASSAWTTSINLVVGNSGTGTLTLSDTGKVNVNGGTGTLVLGDSSGSNGTLNIGATAVNAAAAGGIVNATSIATGAGVGTLQFNTTATVGARYYLTQDGTAGSTPVTISGTTAVIQTAGYTVLTGDNTYSGGTFINGGYLLLGDFGTSGSIAGNVVFGGTVGPGGGELQFLRSDAYAFAGNITGPGRVSNFGSGTTTLSGTNTYSGETFVDAGAIADGTTNALSPNSIFRINSGALLQVNHNETIAGLDDYTAGVSGTATVASGKILTLGQNGSKIFSGSIGGAGSLTKDGVGTQILSGANTYAGATRVNNGTLSVAGAGSISHGSANTFVGFNGGDNGALTVNGGADVTNSQGHVGVSSGSNGSVTVTNAGSTWTNNAQLYVGYQGTGSLSVTNGGAVTNTFADVGAVAGSAGFVDVTGSGSTWTSSSYVMIGNGGTASLLVSGGGAMSNTVGTLGNVGTGHGEAVVTGAGSTWTNTEYLYVGAAGFGLLDILAGGTVTSVDTSIGNNLNGEGAIIVNGPGSSLVNTNTLYVGSEGEGYLEIASGASVTNDTGSVGNNPGGDGGFVEVVGTGSTWTTTGSLIVGNATEGYVEVNTGGTVSAGNATLGAFSGIAGALAVIDSGSSFVSAGNLVIGGNGIGEISLFGAGTATTGGQAIIANNAGSIGDAYLQGAGTQWDITGGNLYVGNAGTGLLRLLDQSVVSVLGGSGTIHLGHSGGVGVIDIGYDGEGYNSGGIINAASITTGPGTGSVLLATTATQAAPFYLTRNGTGAGTYVTIDGSTNVQQVHGYNVFGGNSTYTGTTTISGGTLVAATSDALGDSNVIIDGGTLALGSGVSFDNTIGFGVNGGKLAGEGTFTSPLTLGSGVKLAPGSSPGTMNFGSSLTLNNGGSLEIEIRAPSGTPGTDWDFVSITGAFNLGSLTAGGYSLKVISLDLANNPGAVSGLTGPTSWVIATAGGGIAGFEATDFAIDVSQFFGGGNFTLSQAANDLVLSFSPVPEPSTYALMAAGLALAGLAHRRRKNLSHRR